jgi:CBS domain-containing protein
MTHQPAIVSEECPIHLALAKMRAAEIRHLLVCDGERLSGIVSNRDVRRLVADDPRLPGLAEPVRRIMSEDPVTVAPETPVPVAVRLLLEGRIGALPVRDGERIVGIFTCADALEALLALIDTGD